MKKKNKIKFTRRNFFIIFLYLLNIDTLKSKEKCISTPEQPKGPFYKINTKFSNYDLTNNGKALGNKIEIKGRIIDKNCTPYSNVVMNIWQANTYGKYNHNLDNKVKMVDKNFYGYAKFNCSKNGYYRFITILPGSYAISNRIVRPPHIHLALTTSFGLSFATQLYFKGNKLNDEDFLFNRLENKSLLELEFKKNETGLMSTNFNIVL